MAGAGCSETCNTLFRAACPPTTHVHACCVLLHRGEHYLDKAAEIYVNAFNVVHGE